MDQNIKAMIAEVDAWAAEKLQRGAEPPWAWYNLMMLRDALQRVTDDCDGKMRVPVEHYIEQRDQSIKEGARRAKCRFKIKNE